MTRWILPFIVLSGIATNACSSESAAELILPDGFRAEVLVSGVENARSMALKGEQVLFVSTRGQGRVYRIDDPFGEARVSVALDKLEVPNGIALRGDDLYVAEQNRIVRYPGLVNGAAGDPDVILADLPAEGWHGWHYLAFGPDGHLYVSLGAPCNVCDRPGFDEIVRIDLDEPATETYARGIRNAVGMDWHPETGELWFTDNGRDQMGDDVPACELNRVSEPGEHFGFPFCHGGDTPDPEFAAMGSCADATPPVQQLGPHVAPLGVRFYTGEMFPPDYRGHAFIAEHGSWDRSEKIGYRITLVRLDGDRSLSYEDFATGFLVNGKVLGRPVDIQQAPDGSLLVSDDQQGLIYRISYDAS